MEKIAHRITIFTDSPFPTFTTYTPAGTDKTNNRPGHLPFLSTFLPYSKQTAQKLQEIEYAKKLPVVQIRTAGTDTFSLPTGIFEAAKEPFNVQLSVTTYR